MPELAADTDRMARAAGHLDRMTALMKSFNDGVHNIAAAQGPAYGDDSSMQEAREEHRKAVENAKNVATNGLTAVDALGKNIKDTRLALNAADEGAMTAASSVVHGSSAGSVSPRPPRR